MDAVTTCDACGMPIVFMKQKATFKNPDPKPNPIERNPHPDGNLIVNWTTRTYTVVSKKDLPKAKELKQTLHISHFATCKFKERFRKQK